MERTTEQAYAEYQKSADKLLAAALALSPTPAAPDGPGVLAMAGLLARLRAAADDLAAVQVDTQESKENNMKTIHAEVNDFVRKDGHLVRVMEIDVSEGCYFTSDGGLIGFDEVGENNVFLESEVYDELGGRIPDAVEVPDEETTANAA
jgi:hypothetical protein